MTSEVPTKPVTLHGRRRAERRECWWCGLVPGTPDRFGHPTKAPHLWWRREIDGLMVDICGPCWLRRDLRTELAMRGI